MVGTLSVVAVVVEGGVWILGSTIWLLWQGGVVVDVVDHRGSIGLGVTELGKGSARPGAVGDARIDASNGG